MFTENRPDTGADIGVLTLTGERREVRWLLETPFGERDATLSPDDLWMAYVSDQSGEEEVYISRFPNVSDGLIAVSTGGGRDPMWGPHGDEVFYKSPQGMMAARVETAPTFRVVSREPLFEEFNTDRRNSGYDIDPDGRFLVVRQEPTRIEFVQNWLNELQRLVPSP